MEFGVEWSPQVRDDLNEIAAYIAQDSPRYASALVGKILATGRSLALFPYRGRVVPELGDESIREVLVYSWRLIYQVHGQSVQVIAVVHGRRLVGQKLE